MTRLDDERARTVTQLRAQLAALTAEVEVAAATHAALAAEADRVRDALASILGLRGAYVMAREYVTTTPGPYTAKSGAEFLRAAGWDEEIQGDPQMVALKALGQLHRDGQLVIRTNRPGVYRRRNPGE